MKTHEVAIRFGANTNTVARQLVHIGKQLKAVRRIELLQYHVRTPSAANSSCWMLRLNENMGLAQTNSWQRPGYAFPVTPGPGNRAPVIFTLPRLVSQHHYPTLGAMNVSISDYDGGPVTFTELILWLLIRYDDDYTDLDVVAAEAGLTEPVHGRNNWRNAAGTAHKNVTFEAMANHVFSEIAK